MTKIVLAKMGGVIEALDFDGPAEEWMRVLHENVGSSLRVIRMHRPTEAQPVAVGWASGLGVGVNEPATRLARSLFAIHPMDKIMGPFALGGVDTFRGEIEPPPTWATQLLYRYCHDERERLKPSPSLERLERSLRRH